MKKGVSFKSMLMLIGLVTIAIPGILNVVACAVKGVKEEPEQTNPALSVVDAINVVVYQQEVVYGSKVEELKALITADFIKAKLTGEVKDAFQAGLFVLNKITKINNEELLDSDLKKVAKINVKINYDYGKFTNQTTNLEINIQAKRKLLNDTFKDFEFKDEKGIINFLDTNNLNVITKQIETFLGKSLDEGGLILENKQATSILLKAKPESKKYQGEITLTWNLKLFEIYGSKEISDNIFIKEGLRGYFYVTSGLDTEPYKIEYFDVYGYLNPNMSIKLNHSFSLHVGHKDGRMLVVHIWHNEVTDGISNRFKENYLLHFTKEIHVAVNTLELDKVKIFDAKTNNWKGLNKVIYLNVNNLGEIRKT